MTFLTHRATPSCLPENEKPAAYATADAMLKAMLEDAAAIKQRAGNQIIQDHDETSDADILAVIKANPGKTSDQIAAMLKRGTSVMRTRLGKLQNRKMVEVKFTRIKGHRARLFYPVDGARPEPQEVKRASPVRDKIVAFIKANPGCTTPQVAAHLGMSPKTTAAAINRSRKQAGINSERNVTGNGNSVPARHWVIE